MKDRFLSPVLIQVEVLFFKVFSEHCWVICHNSVGIFLRLLMLWTDYKKNNKTSSALSKSSSLLRTQYMQRMPRLLRCSKSGFAVAKKSLVKKNLKLIKVFLKISFGYNNLREFHTKS